MFAPPPPCEQADEPPRPGRVTRPPGHKAAQHELDTAERLARLGYDVEFRVRDPNRRSADVLLSDGHLWELKSPKSARRDTIYDRLTEGTEQSARIVLDMHRSPLNGDRDAAKAIIDAARRDAPTLRVVRVLDTIDGPLGEFEWPEGG